MTAPMIQPVTIHTQSPLSLGCELVANSVVVNTYSSFTWAVANRAVYYPIWLPSPVVAVQMFVYNGATVSGNVDVGLYANDGSRLISQGSTLQTGTNVLQAFDITDTVLGPGRYYMAMVLDNTIGTFFQVGFASTMVNRALGVFTESAAFPLPAKATFAAATTTRVSMMGLSTRTVL